jgi:primase-polymerase (primpol)-like protein
VSIGDGQEFIDWLASKIRPETSPETAKTNGHVTSRMPSRSLPSDEQVIEKCRAAENAAKFADLFDHGDVHVHHDGDDSVADLALLSMLSFYTQDEAQLERIFSSSALGQRAKWRRRHDYRERTIGKALSDLGEAYKWPREREQLLSSSSPTPYI